MPARGAASPMTGAHNRALAAAVVAAATMGTLGWFVREAPCSAPLCGFARFAVGLALLLPLLLFRARRGERVWAFSWQAALSGIGIGVCILFYFLAMRCTTIALAVLLVYTGPVLASVGEALLNRRMPPLRDGVLLLFSAAGLSLVCAGGDAEHAANGLGACYSLISALGYAVYLLCNSHMPEEVGLMRRTFWQFSAGCLFSAGPLMMSAAPVALPAAAWGWLLAIGACHGFVVMLLIVYASRRLSSIQYGTIAYLEPVVAVGIGFCVYGETLAPLQWGGFIMVIVASLAPTILPNRRDN